MHEPLAVATLQEVAAVLHDHGGTLPCTPELDVVDGEVRLTLRVHASLDALELGNRLRHLLDVANIRAIAARWGIDAAKLEALLPPEEDR